ncbi:unnamed protein product [Mortierella alpina]
MSNYLPEKSPAQLYPPPQQDGQGFAAQSNVYAPAPAPAAAAAPYDNNDGNINSNAGQPGMAQVSASGYPGANAGPPGEFIDPTVPRPNDILPLHPAIIQQRQIAATLPPCPRGGYHELRTHRDVFSECEDDEDPDAILENDDLLLTETLLAQCGCSLTALKVVDYSSSGRIWDAVMERIHLNRTLEGARLLNGIRVLDITLTYRAFESAFQPILRRPKSYPGARALFAGVKELRLCGTEAIMDSAEELAWEEEVCYDSGDDADERLSITFSELIALFPSLRKLTLDNIDVFSDKDIEGSEEGAEAASGESIVVTTARPVDYQFHTLNFQACGISVKQITQILIRSRSVQSLKIGGYSPQGTFGLLINSLPMLTPLLTEYGQESIHFSDWSIVLPGLPCLTRLYISTDSLISDDALGILSRSCLGLEDLYLHYCQSLTYRGLHHILRSCKQLKSLKLPMTPLHWNIFGQDSEHHNNSTTAPSTTTTAPPPPSAFVPWACQDTLQDLLLTLVENNPPQYLSVARQRLQSLSRLSGLELQGHKLSAAILMDLEHQHPSSGPLTTLYPALRELNVHSVYPQLTLDHTIKLVRSMPKLTKVWSGKSFDIRSLKWLAKHNKYCKY